MNGYHQLKEWVQERIKDANCRGVSLNVHELAGEADKEFRKDRLFAPEPTAPVCDLITVVVIQVAQDYMHLTRDPKRQRDQTAGKGKMPKIIKRKDPWRFYRAWRESVAHRDVPLLKSTQAVLLEAAASREARSGGEYRKAQFLRELAKGMNATQTVEERYTAAELDGIYAETVDKAA